MAKRPARKDVEAPGLFDGVAPSPPPSSEAGSARPDSTRRSTRARASSRGTERPAADEAPRVLTVSELTADIKRRIDALGRVRVEGELSGWKRAASGHLYFDLKDEHARVSCVVWRSQVERALRFEPEEGVQVVAVGRLDVYPPRGSYSLIVERLEPRGIGALLAQLEQLKRELSALGWFARSRPLPTLPACVGVVTSRDGAALRDFLRTRSVRWPGFPVRLCHSAVQGPGAAREIADAIARLDRSGVDVIVVCRGGGSLEDLWAFNERPVAEAIWNASVPVVSGVGHETDTTLADLVADHRAHTPTDAAQTVLPDRAALLAELRRWGNYLMEALDGLMGAQRERLATLASRRVLRSPAWILDDRRRLARLAATRLRQAARLRLRTAANGLQPLFTRLERQSPRLLLVRWRERTARAGQRMTAAAEASLARRRQRFELATGNLEARSPLAVLRRGYSLTTRKGDTTPVTKAGEVATGDEIETRLADGGALVSRILDVLAREREDRKGS